MNDLPPPSEAPRVERDLARRSALRRLWSALGPFVVLIALVLLFAVVVGDDFSSARNLRNIASQSVIVVIGAIGMTLVIVAGGIDISAGSVIALCSIVGARAAAADLDPALAALAAIAAGAGVGAINGAIIAFLRLPAFIVTLGMLGAARGAAKLLAGNSVVNPSATQRGWIEDLMWTRAFGLVPAAWLALGLALLGALIARRSVFGRRLYAVGSNANAARLCGVRVGAVTFATYAIAGAFFGLGGLVQLSKVTGGDPTGAAGLELDIIAAVVIGGAALSGGSGTITGSVVGALIIGTLRNGTQALGWENPVQEIMIGVVIVIAVALDRWRQSRGARAA